MKSECNKMHGERIKTAQYCWDGVSRAMYDVGEIWKTGVAF